MYVTNINQAFNGHKVFAPVIKLYELLKLSLKPNMYKNADNKESLNYIVNSLKKGLTVIDVGYHHREYLPEMMKIADHAGKLIAFEPDDHIYNYLLKMKQLLTLKNVIVEKYAVSKEAKNRPYDHSSKKRPTGSAPVVNIFERIDNTSKKFLTTETIDSYCLANDIKPDLIKLKADGNELEILNGSIQTIKMYKPKILIECGDRNTTPEGLLATFKYLKDVSYAGYFILDTMKIPLSSFDFNIYQNELIGFYCNNFIFE